jgi:hypothetical protein
MKKRIAVLAAGAVLLLFSSSLVQEAGAVEVKRGTAPGAPGMEATEVITATGPDFTVYYVKKGAIRIQTRFMEEFAKTPVGKYVGDSLQKGMSVEDVVVKGMDAGHSPCDLLKGLIVQGAKLVAIIKVYLERNILPPCGVLRCALDAVRGVKMVEVEAGQYSIIAPGGCAIEGGMTENDWQRLETLMREGLISAEELPHYPPDKEQSVAAGCCETVELAQVFLAAGADLEDLRACLNTMGCTGLGYASPPPPPPPPVTPPGPPSPSS